jgi:hypothetical protein
MSLNIEETIYLNPNLNTLFDVVKSKLDKYDKKLLTVVDIIQNVIEVVELTKLKGNSKKEFALQLVERCIEYLPDTCFDLKNNIKLSLDNGFISDTIDLIIKASKQELKINGVIDVVKSNYFKKLVMSCFSFCIKK